MEESNRNSMKLDIEAVRLADSDRTYQKETYKPIAEYLENSDGFGVNNLAAVKNSNMVTAKSDNIEDGADESMLGGEKDKLAQKEEVKFITGDHQNGDAKIDIGALDKNFTGMTKEELLKYANDPFWVRLRWIFFILFWGLWIAMLVGAILIIVGAPKCAAPTPLAWYKQGPLAIIKSDSNQENVENYKSIGIKGVIYELPADETYRVNTPEVENKIKKIVETFKNNSDIRIILDVTPNFVTKDDELYQEALKDPIYRTAFVWAEREVAPTNWVSKVNGSAWKEVIPKNFVLSQFGEDRFDLQMNDTLAKDKFKEVLISLVKMGINGFRLTNPKHFIINTDYKDEVTSIIPNTVHTDYDYWTHTQTTYQNGIGDLLYEFSRVVQNATNGDGYLSVTENIVRSDVFKTSKHGIIGVELPIYGLLPHTLAGSLPHSAKQLRDELTEIVNELGNGTWVQWEYDQNAMASSKIGYSEYNMFLMLLPGVPVATLDEFIVGNSTTYINDLRALRESPSYMHGSFDVYTDNNKTVIAYTRIKSGNPGYFVAYNPTDAGVSSNFADVKGMPEQLTVHLYSKNYNVDKIVEKVKVSSSAIPIAARSVIILTYVPKTSD